MSTAQEVGLKNYPPPYLAPSTVGEVLLSGVNYASSGSGILNGTGALFVSFLLDVAVTFVVQKLQF